MGVNISAYRLLEKVKDDDGYQEYTYWKTEKHDFDSLRYSGDKDFVFNSPLKWDSVSDGDDNDFNERSYIRPANINLAIAWVNVNVFEGNRLRLIKLLQDMKADPKLFIHISY